jgi:uncharacterized protein (TIGR03437 family)
MMRIGCALAFFLVFGIGRGNAQNITLNPGSVLRYTFNVDPSSWGSNTPDVVRLAVSASTEVYSPPVTLNAGIYNGSTLLGNVSSGPTSFSGSTNGVILYWKSPGSLWSETPASFIDFTSILSGSIQGRIDISVTGGPVVIPTPIYDPPAGGLNCCISMLYRAPGATWSFIPGPITNLVQSLVDSTLPAISLSRNSATAGSPPFMLTVTGSGFLAGSLVQWNGSSLSSSYVNGSQMTAAVPANMIAAPGTASVAVTNPGGAFSDGAPFTVNPQGTLSITIGSPLPPGAAGVAYSQSLAATGGVSPFNWSIVAGALPPGISLTANGGAVSGVPTMPGTYSFTIQVRDSANTTSATPLSLTIGPGGISVPTNGIVNAAGFTGGGVAPGEIVTIFGTGFGPSSLAGSQLDNRGYVSTSLAGLQVLFDGFPAPLIYIQANQVSAVVPYLIAGKTSSEIQISELGRISNAVTVPVLAAAPGIFTVDASGRGQGVIINQDGTANSPANPASAGAYVSVYATGEGQTSPGGADGKLGGTPAPRPVQSVTATVGGVNANVQYAGGVSGTVAGVLQVNVQIPLGVAPGGSVPIVLTIGGQTTAPNVTLAVH